MATVDFVTDKQSYFLTAASNLRLFFTNFMATLDTSHIVDAVSSLPKLLTASVLGVLSVSCMQTKQPDVPQRDAGQLFATRCVTCHTAENSRAPTFDVLRQWSPEAVADALENGVMRQQAIDFSTKERKAVAELVTGRKLGEKSAQSSSLRCAKTPRFDLNNPGRWTGWGPDFTNRRLQSVEAGGITLEQIPKLRLRWSFGFPGEAVARSLPTVAGGRLFVGSQRGTVYSLDAKTGCIIWTFQAEGAVRSGIVIGKNTDGSSSAYVGDSRAQIYSLDAKTGKQNWVRKVDDHFAAQILGTPALHQGRLFVSMSSTEETNALDPNYECCTFSGSVSALNAATGEVLWKTYALNKSVPEGVRPSGVTRHGPSGGAIWSSPTIDVKRGRVYAATGNQYTSPPDIGSNAVIAFDINTGAKLWASQTLARDYQMPKCDVKKDPKCDEVAGPDLDFGSPPILTTMADGRDLIVIAQKSGMGWAMDPDREGAIVWQYRAGKGGMLGGTQWGSASDAEHAYFPVSDVLLKGPGALHAVRLHTGERAWAAALPEPICGEKTRGCNSAISAAITVTANAVFTGSFDGGVRAYSTRDGSLLWEYDTNQQFKTVNGVPANGASINGPGPIVAGGMVYVGSGYANFGGRSGNVLLAFGPE